MYRSFVPLASAPSLPVSTGAPELKPKLDGTPMSPPPISMKQRRHHHTDDEWEAHRDLITQLSREHKTREVMRLMASEPKPGFYAGSVVHLFVRPSHYTDSNVESVNKRTR